MGYLTEDQTFHPSDNDYDNEQDVSNISKVKKGKDCYYSDVVGRYIVDAITGAKYPWNVGSLDEQRFFKVTDTTNNVDRSRKGEYNCYHGRTSRKAFYENPHAYMKFSRIELDDDLINEWYDKRERLYPEEYTHFINNN